LIFAANYDPIPGFIELNWRDFSLCYREALNFGDFGLFEGVEAKNAVLEAD